jgi:hypothetical protein
VPLPLACRAATYPWGANVVPEPAKFANKITGTYNGAGGDQT